MPPSRISPARWFLLPLTKMFFSLEFIISKEMKKTVFLSGPIRGISRKESLSWRKNATKKLARNFFVVHAFRGREEKETFTDSRLAVIRDKADIHHSDILLVNDTFVGSSMIGTSMEVLIAHQSNKPVIVFGHAHDNDYWLNYHIHARMDSLDDACDLLNKMFF